MADTGDTVALHRGCCRLSGRYTFTDVEARGTVAASARAVAEALRRLRADCRIATPRRGFNVIVPPEYRGPGCPPAGWFIDDLMRYVGRPYYVALLSAAAFHGAAHQQPMLFQVVTDRPLPVGGSWSRRHRLPRERPAETTPVDQVPDRDRLYERVHAGGDGLRPGCASPLPPGGWATSRRCCRSWPRDCEADELRALSAMRPTTEIQRLGCLFDMVGRQQLADPLARVLAVSRRRALDPAGGLIGRAATGVHGLCRGASCETRPSTSTLDTPRAHHRVAHAGALGVRRAGRAGPGHLAGPRGDTGTGRPPWSPRHFAFRGGTGAAQAPFRPAGAVLGGHRPRPGRCRPIGPVLDEVREALDPLARGAELEAERRQREAALPLRDHCAACAAHAGEGRDQHARALLLSRVVECPLFGGDALARRSAAVRVAWKERLEQECAGSTAEEGPRLVRPVGRAPLFDVDQAASSTASSATWLRRGRRSPAPCSRRTLPRSSPRPPFAAMSIRCFAMPTRTRSMRRGHS